MMAEDTGLDRRGAGVGLLAAEGTKMLGYVVVERAEPVRIIALQCEDFVIADGLLRRALHPFTRRAARAIPLRAKCPCRCRWPIPAGGAGSLRSFLREMPRKYRRNLKNLLRFSGGNVIITKYRLIVCKEV